MIQIKYNILFKHNHTYLSPKHKNLPNLVVSWFTIVPNVQRIHDRVTGIKENIKVVG